MSVARTVALDQPGANPPDPRIGTDSASGRSSPHDDPTPDGSDGPPPASIGGHPIVAELGRGGMGVVYLAYEPSLERHVALKTVWTRGDAPESAAEVRQLLHEAQIAGQLCHAGIVPVHRIGFDAEHGAYYTMRYVEGRTFDDVLDARRAEDTDVLEEFPRRRLVRLFLYICRAVGFAHQHGVMHRDLKPSNLIVTPHGEPFVIDWGLACRTEVVDRAGRGGTMGYLAPECMRGSKDVGPASDVYSLGAILYEILTLQMPTGVDSPAECVDRTLHGEIEPLDPSRVWAPLVPLVTRCLALDPADRFADANALADELEDVLEGRSSLRDFVRIDGRGDAPDESPLLIDGSVASESGAWVLAPSTALRTPVAMSGEWRAELDIVVPTDLCAWGVAVEVSPDTDERNAYLRLHLGRSERVTLGLARQGRLVGRSLDLRPAPGSCCRLGLIAEGSRFVVTVDGRKVLDVHEPFPLSRSHLRVANGREPIRMRRLRLRARGAPLYLSFLSLPDQLVHQCRFAEARDLYLELHRAHPDRGEGHTALYKAALCATALGRPAQAVREFCQLEGGPLDHACALGLAHLGTVEGTLDWGNTALADAYLRHRDRRTRRELWFALMNLVDTAQYDSAAARADMACNLLADLRPDGPDAEQLTLMLLDACRADGGPGVMRRTAMRLVESFPDQPAVVEQALLSLHYGGLDELAISLVRNALPAAIDACSSSDRRIRLLLMDAEVALAFGDQHAAHTALERAREAVPEHHPDQVWTMGWSALARWLASDSPAVLVLADRAHDAGPAATTQAAHLGLLEALAHVDRGDGRSARARLETLSAADHLWGRTAEAMLSRATASEFADTVRHYPRRLVPEAAFYLAEYKRCVGEHDGGRDLFTRIADEWVDRALFQRVSRQRCAAVVG